VALHCVEDGQLCNKYQQSRRRLTVPIMNSYCLNHCGINEEILDGFKSHLRTKKQRVELKASKYGIFFFLGDFKHGVPQDWVLVIFFLTYTSMVFPCKLINLLRR
jgi:hypothetical protein